MEAKVKAALSARVKELKAEKKAGPALATRGVDPKSAFCMAWPAAKAALVLLGQIVKNPLLKGAITAAVTIGDQVSKAVCG
ncbi:MAG: hypothetical protein U0Q16_15880 [Bryobacteraceae bacterium]